MKESVKDTVREIAKERIGVLLNLAGGDPDPYSEYAAHYVKLARRISEHYKITIDRSIAICKRCNAVLIPGKNAEVKIASHGGYAAYRCRMCGKEVHMRYKPRTGLRSKLPVH